MHDFLGEENEYLIRFAKQQLTKTPDIDFFVFGHRHILLDFVLNKQSRLLILGDWISYFSYAVWDGKEMRLEQFECN